MTLPELSYSHSDARLEDKAKFIEGVMGRKATVKSLEFPDMTVQVVGNTAMDSYAITRLLPALVAAQPTDHRLHIIVAPCEELAAARNSPRVIFDASISRALRPPLAAHAMANTMEVRQRIVEPSRQSSCLPRQLP